MICLNYASLITWPSNLWMTTLVQPWLSWLLHQAVLLVPGGNILCQVQSQIPALEWYVLSLHSSATGLGCFICQENCKDFTPGKEDIII